METETATKRRTRANHERMMRIGARIVALYDNAAHFHWTFDELEKEKASIRTDFAGRTQYERGYFEGIDRVLWDQMYRSFVWRLGTADGPLPEGEKPQEYRLMTHGGHFWRGTDIAFHGYNPL